MVRLAKPVHARVRPLILIKSVPLFEPLRTGKRPNETASFIDRTCQGIPMTPAAQISERCRADPVRLRGGRIGPEPARLRPRAAAAG